MPLPSPPLFLFDRLVRTYQPGDASEPGVHWRILTSEDKKAFGFGEMQDEADSVVRDLVLGADLDGLQGCSSLILRGGNLYTCIHTVDKDLVLIAADFPEFDSLGVFIIFDAIDRSLRMIPTMPRTYSHILVPCVLVARQDDKDRSYALVYPGCDADDRPALLVSPSSSNLPWSTVKKANFPTRWLSHSRFHAQEVFSFRGRGYWVDLLCGIMYCECRDLLSEDNIPVDVKSIDLPVGCSEWPGSKDLVAAARAFRAMGPVGDSIKFVNIDGYLQPMDFKYCKVTVWTLKDDMKWAVEHELQLASLWEGGEFRGDPVSDLMAPMYPFLSTHEDHVIYFALGSYIRGKRNCFPGTPSCMLRVDLCSKTFSRTELSPEVRTSMGVVLPLYRNTEGKLLGLPA